ncbi:hypothetical protein L198_06137 [Cryptococcus wingfieldii CBS 7118]|uniref:Uncharacterized protein n=1 Tax=Cryptococcus wingfieldii CBS 7118 TaxID=1295528 RepID=A0A1E3IQD2_9TREE|nr:hypothetical protein L198_06137 [Cryptococcus wingfieldii CBS 7118]ODN90820.1 hypothetical protein L198_06137 [Cryptococcus wingfieldii CBS 7118]
MPRPSLPPIDPSTPPELICPCRKRVRPQLGASCEFCASKSKRQAAKRLEGRQKGKVARKLSELNEHPVFSTKVDLQTAAMSLLRAHHASPETFIHAAGHADEPSDEVISIRGSYQSPVEIQAAWSVPPGERPLNFGDAEQFLRRIGPTIAGVDTDSPYKFTYHDIPHSTDIPDTSTDYDCVARFICCQSLQSKRNGREKEKDPSKKARLGRTCMRRFDCQGEMTLRYDFALNALRLCIKHSIPHVTYQSVTFPDEALTVVERLVADGTVDITPIMQRITFKFPHLTWISRAQVRNAVRETLSSRYLLDKEPIQSLRAGLAQAAENGSVGLIDIDVPGVTAIAWAVLPILDEIKRRHLTVEEAFMDATCEFQERAVTSNTRDTNTQREKRRGKGRWYVRFYDAMKAVASMKHGEPGSSADVN